MTDLREGVVVPGDAVRNVLWEDFYGPFLTNFLGNGLEYKEDRSDPPYRDPLQRCADLKASARTDITLFIFAYDWRQPIENNAQKLAKLITCVRELHDVPQVNIIGHSMGGLVAGTYAQTAGDAVYIDKLITVATPWQGSPKLTLSVLTGKEPLSKKQRIALDVTYTCLLYTSKNVEVIKGMLAVLGSDDNQHLLQIDINGDGSIDQYKVCLLYTSRCV